MPKMKTHSGTKKRVRLSGSGKLIREQTGGRHLFEKMSSRKKRRTILERAEGYRGQRSRLYRKAKEQVTHSLVYAYRDRRAKKGEFRRLWIQRINAAARANGLTYNRLIQGLGLAGVEVDRRILAELAVNEPAAFAGLVEVAKKALPTDVNAPAA